MRAAFPRALSIVLLVFIVCGTTIEAAHNHGNVAGSNSVTSAAHFSDAASESKLRTGLTGCGDCLICQLHQHFSTTVIAAPLSIAPALLIRAFTHTNAVAARSQTGVTRTGRAPPQSSF